MKNIENNKLNTNGIYSATELLNRNISEIPCLVEPLFPKVGLCGLAGSSDTGKSSLLRQLATSVSLGDNIFLGFKLLATNKRAIYVSTEDDDFAISFLLQKEKINRSDDNDDYKGLTFIFDTHDLLNKIEKLLIKNKVDLIIIDAFTDLYGKSMNDTNQVRTFLNDYSQLAQKYECLIIFLHHTGKHTDNLAPSKHNLLGSQGFEAKMRMVVELRKDKVDHQKRHLCIVKGNYLSDKYKDKSFVLKFDENLQFTNSGERVSFDELKANNHNEERKKVIALKKSGKNQTEIAEKLNISQPTVSRILRNK